MFKKLLKDSMAFFSNSFFSKLAGILLVAVYTRFLTTEEYGSGELIYNTATFLMPLITMGVTDGIMRFSLEKKNDHSELLTCGYMVIFIGMIITSIVGLGLVWFNQYPFEDLMIILILSLELSLDSVYGAYIKGCDRTKSFALIGIFRTIILVIAVVVTIVVFRMGEFGYFLSLMISYLASVLMYIVDSKFKILLLSRPSKKLIIALIVYSLPLISNSLCWKVVNLSDKFFIAHYFDNAMVGIYSVSQKIPVIISTFTGVFIQAWQITATRQHQKNQLSGAFNSVQGLYCWFIGTVSILSIIFSKQIIHLFVGEQFRAAYIFIPFLVIGAFFNSMTAFSGSAYMVTKKTISIFYSSLTAAIVNIVLNALLIPRIGAMGAAIATVTSYATSWGIRIVRLKSCQEVAINNKVPIVTGIALAFIAILYTTGLEVISGILGVLTILISFTFIKKELTVMVKELFLNSRRKGVK